MVSKREIEHVREDAGEILRRDDGLVVYPTESYYALGAALHEEALARLVTLKGREPGKPLPLAAATCADVVRIAHLDGPLRVLAETLWPGPLTLALHPRIPLPAELKAVDGTVGVRVSQDDWVRTVAEAAGGLVTATSANFAGAPPAASVGALDERMVRGVDRVMDGGVLPGGAPSTVVGMVRGRVVVFRVGAVSPGALAAVLGYEPVVGS